MSKSPEELAKLNEHRQSGGLFGARPDHPAEVTLGSVASGRDRAPENVGTDPRTPDQVFAGLLADAGTTTEVRPVGLTRTRAALRNARGEKDGAVRYVIIGRDSGVDAADDRIDVVAPKDGRPLFVHTMSGFAKLRIVSGHAIVVAESRFGNPIHVEDGARLTLIGGEDRKVSVTAKPGSTVDFHAEPTSRGYQHIEDGAEFRLHGRADRLSLTTDPSWGRR